ncbi:hypothetical protein BG005_009885 [Podila minutissima]|nr:hypothetical protein BG005_009885 [Podila minutissima]
MSGKSKASKEQVSSSGTSSGNNNSNTINNTSPASSIVTSGARKPRKGSSEAKPQKKPSFLQRLFCCGAGNFVNDNEHLYVGEQHQTVYVTGSKSIGKKPSTTIANTTDPRTEEKPRPPSEPADESVSTAVVEEDEEGEEEKEDEDEQEDEPELEQPQTLGGVVPGFLAPVAPEHEGRKCLVLDLDETLVHSSFKLIPQADYVVPVDIDNQTHNVYVIKRPGVDTFLKKMGEIYEVVIFTASLSKYADPVLDMLDVHQVVKHRLFRESCLNHKGNYVKDLSVIGRDLKNTIIIDNSPASYIFHQSNAVPISSWFNDPHDTELLDLIPFLADLTVVDDVNPVLDMNNDEE